VVEFEGFVESSRAWGDHAMEQTILTIYNRHTEPEAKRASVVTGRTKGRPWAGTANSTASPKRATTTTRQGERAR
jgi:hypothetical protein